MDRRWSLSDQGICYLVFGFLTIWNHNSRAIVHFPRIAG